jgi:hypothetical protein
MASIGGPGEINLKVIFMTFIFLIIKIIIIIITKKEYQSFSDINNSKNKVVTCVQWHPTLKGIVAMSLAENFSLYDRIDNLSKSVISSSLILIWSFVDPIQPKVSRISKLFDLKI